MTDGQSLFILFLALYLVECVRWQPGVAWLLGGAAGGWWLRRPLQQVEIAGRKPVLLPTLPPVGAHVITFPWLMVPGEAGLEFFPDEAAPPVLIPWSDLSPRTENSTLFLTTTHRLHLPDETLAARWKQRLQEWAAAEPKAREEAFLLHARQTLDTEALTKDAEATAAKTKTLRLLGGVIFIWCFGVLTGIYRWLGESWQVLAAATVLLLLLWVQTVIFWRAAGRCTPPVSHRFWKALAMALLPQHAMRAGDLICRQHTPEAHPLAARKLIGESAWLNLARQFWKSTRHGQGQTVPLRTQALEAFFKAQSLDPAQLEEMPERQAGSAAYCPRCQSQFRDALARCRDCGDLELKPFPQTTA